jgi:Cyclic nucleotide-binding domain
MRVESSATSLSWIPSEAVTGVMKSAFTAGVAHYDEPPASTLPDLEALPRESFRFANHLHVWARFDGDRVAEHGQQGGVRMGNTTASIGKLGVSFAAVAMPDLQPEPVVGEGSIRFTQTCGGRTAAPLPRQIPRPPYVRLQAPLVWTTLAITLHSDGRTDVELAGASMFPRHWVYGADGQLALKAGVADWATWMSQPSRKATPWGDEDSPVVVTAAETALERRLSSSLMRGGAKPQVHRHDPGSQLVRQGDPGRSLFLLLDGVLRIDVDGEPLGEVGPGAVLGERAVLEGGRRTATLTAITPICVAEASADEIDRDALARLAEGHRREEERAAAAEAAPR